MTPRTPTSHGRWNGNRQRTLPGTQRSSEWLTHLSTSHGTDTAPQILEQACTCDETDYQQSKKDKQGPFVSGPSPRGRPHQSWRCWRHLQGLSRVRSTDGLQSWSGSPRGPMSALRVERLYRGREPDTRADGPRFSGIAGQRGAASELEPPHQLRLMALLDRRANFGLDSTQGRDSAQTSGASSQIALDRAASLEGDPRDHAPLGRIITRRPGGRQMKRRPKAEGEAIRSV
jgi:hypothetical protein